MHYTIRLAFCWTHLRAAFKLWQFTKEQDRLKINNCLQVLKFVLEGKMLILAFWSCQRFLEYWSCIFLLFPSIYKTASHHI